MIAYRSDDALKEDVLHELAWDSRIDPKTIRVEVGNRIVTLTGTARSYAEKVAAQRAAHRVAGVLDVVSDIVVLASERLGRTDTELAAAVRHGLQWDVRVPDERIRSTVSDGWVRLDGTVDFLRQREDAEDAVRALSGVRGVQNQVVVAPRAVDPRTVRAAIEGALARHARHEAHRIEVAVDDGIVTLSGPVDSFAEKRAVLGLVSHLPGIRAVQDGLMLPA